MDTYTLSRRQFLQGSAMGVGGLAVGTGNAAAAGDRYIVGARAQSGVRAARRNAAAVHRVLDFGEYGTAVAGVFSTAAAAALSRRTDVSYVELDGLMHAIAIDSGDSEVPWGVDRVDAEVAHSAGATGAGAHVAIIDTGIDSDHPDLVGNLGEGAAFVSARGPYAEAWDDDNGHGTHCAGSADAADDGSGVVGTSSAATLHAVKVLDKNGSGNYSNVAAGIKHVADKGWHVGSLSLGGPKSSTIENACAYAADRGVLLVAAAGNDGGDVENAAPATYATVMAVSATDSNDRLASWSNRGADIEIAAPGVDIYSTYPGGGYRTFSGTSMACPHVSGAAAQLFALGYDHATARQRLRDTAENIGLSSDQQGAGLLDVEAAVGGSVDARPSVTWLSPANGDTVSGPTAISIDATDAADVAGTLTVEWAVDGGAWQPTTYDTGTGSYTATWETTAVADADYALDARAIDSAGGSTTAGVTVTVANSTDPGTGDAPTGTIDEAGLSEIASRNPHAEFSVPWSASDANSDLATVELTLSQTSPATVLEDTVTLDVTGDAASGTTSLQAKHANGDGATYAVALTVTDGTGATGGDRATITEDGQ